MRIPVTQHAEQAWRISEIAGDFTLIDAWALPVTGQLAEFVDLRGVFTRLEPRALRSATTRTLVAIRRSLGRWMGWDRAKNQLAIPGCAEVSLAERLPAELRSPETASIDRRGFRLLYRTTTETASEISNGTVHAVRHLGWIAQPDGTYRGQLRVYVKPRGAFGRAYMTAIRPFRLFIVYPALMRTLEAAWAARAPRPSPA